MIKKSIEKQQIFGALDEDNELNSRVSASSVTFFSPSPRRKSSNLGWVLSSVVSFGSRR